LKNKANDFWKKQLIVLISDAKNKTVKQYFILKCAVKRCSVFFLEMLCHFWAFNNIHDYQNN